MKPIWKHYGDLNCLENRRACARTVILMLHGYGADPSDLYPLSSYLDPEGSYDWIFPEAPLSLANPLGQSGRAWFPIEERDLMRAVAGEGLDWSNWDHPGIREASEQLCSVIRAFSGAYDQILIGGFSQGSVIALDTILESDLHLSGLCLLSSTLMKKARWEELLTQRSVALPYFQSHGTADPVLPFSLAEQLHHALSRFGWEGVFHRFSGGHEIPEPILQKLKHWIAELSVV